MMTKTNHRMLTLCWQCLVLSIFCSGMDLDSVFADDDESNRPTAKQIITRQQQLAERYKLLESKLFALHEYERDINPMRSNLLRRAYLQSQEKMTGLQLDQIVRLLNDQNLRDAEDRQELVIEELESLLQLLESEDRGQRVRDDIRRYQEYLKEVERLQRMQRGIRAQTESGGNGQRLANSQENTANRTERLAREIRRNEESQDVDSADDTGKNEGSESDTANPGDNPPSNQQKNGESPDEDREPGSDSQQPGDSKDGEKSNDNRPAGAGSEGSSGTPSGDASDEPQETTEGQAEGGQAGNPVRQRLEAAERRMRNARQKLEQAKRADSIDEMRAAEKEISLAKQELEEILRQLREEEVERVLAMLEGRFRNMLEREIRVYESTRKLEQRSPAERNADFEIRAGKLAKEQNAIATEASRALMLLKEDGSSVAFPETVQQMRDDMIQVGQRLSSAKVGRITLEIEEDIIDTLDYLIEALVKTQQDMEAMKQSGPPSEGGMPGDMPLVDQLAEIKMMRGLQERIYKRHQRYSRLLADPDDEVGETDDPDLRRALLRLSERQKQLTEIAREIVRGNNR